MSLEKLVIVNKRYPASGLTSRLSEAFPCLKQLVADCSTAVSLEEEEEFRCFYGWNGDEKPDRNNVCTIYMLKNSFDYVSYIFNCNVLTVEVQRENKPTKYFATEEMWGNGALESISKYGLDDACKRPKGSILRMLVKDIKRLQYRNEKLYWFSSFVRSSSLPSFKMNLPFEVLQNIFKYLDRGDLLKSQRVCKLWSRPAQTILYAIVEWESADKSILYISTITTSPDELGKLLENINFSRIPQNSIQQYS